MARLNAHSRAPVSRALRAGGFTLIEVLVVSAILALLIALLLPSLAAARQKAQRLACAGNLRAFGHALNLYRSELGRYPAPGDRDPVKAFGPSWRPGDPKPGRSPDKLTDIADLSEALVYASLGDPRAMYCPSSLQSDPYAPRPYVRRSWNEKMVPTWRAGSISYIYLLGLDTQDPACSFPDAQGQPTFNQAAESPEQPRHRVNPRAVLIGDRCVELVPPNRCIPDSNHGSEGGWFLLTPGHVQWWAWPRLSAHPTSIYIWYWPRVGPPVPAVN